MSSFATHRRRVGDGDLPPHRRLSNLRSCILKFGPYGFRSTYFYLTISAGIPRDLNADPESLTRAADELHAAREIWLAGIEPLKRLRREAKRRGDRALPDASWWDSHGHAPWSRADPCRIPDMPLSDYIRRQLDRASGMTMSGCLLCGNEAEPVSHATGHGFIDRCRQCGVLITPCQCGARHWDEARRFDTLRPGIWQRHHMGDDGRPDPHWPGWTNL